MIKLTATASFPGYPNTKASSTLEIYDYVPIVEIDLNQLTTPNTGKWKYENFKILSDKGSTELSNLIDSSKRKQKLHTIQFDSGISEIIVKFNINKGYNKSTDTKGFISFIGKGVTIETRGKIHIEYGKPIALRISSKDLQENAYIDFYADDDDKKGTKNIFCGRIKVTKIEQGYPIIRITKQKVGTAKQRILGVNYKYSADEYATVDTYKATLTESKNPSKIIKSFQVTRDAFAIMGSDLGPKKSILSNLAFEPKEANHYTGVYMKSYPYKHGNNDTPAIKLTQRGSEEMFAEANQDAVDLGYRKVRKDVVRGIMIHVGGIYDNEYAGIITGASLGCFSIINTGNSATNTSDALVIEIIDKVKEMAENSTDKTEKKDHIRIIIEKRMKHEIPNKISHTMHP